MSAFTTATGNLGQEPEIKFSKAGVPYLNVSIAATPRRFNKQTQQWENRGDDLWLRATFFNEDAEKLAEILSKGAKITVSGTLTRREWNRSDGSVAESWELDGARFLGIVPKAQNTSQASQDRFSAPQQQNPGTWTSGTNMAPQNGAQDPAGNLGNVEQQFNQQDQLGGFNAPPF